MPSAKPLTILHVTAPGAAGGLESVVLALTGGLAQAGHRAVLAASLGPGDDGHPIPAKAEQLGVEVRRLVVPPRAYAMEYRLHKHAIAEYRPDVVHTHGYRADLIAGSAAKAAKTPWVSTVHGFTGGDRKNRFYEWMQIRAYRRAAGVVAVSAPIKARLVSAGVAAERIHLLPNAWTAVPILPRSEARGRLGLSCPEPVIGWVGRLTREKGADLFLEALALLGDRPWHASIIGDGRERANLEAQAHALGIGDRVSWHGLVSDAAGFYSAFDLWVLSSRTEGTPIALFEAMAARVPAIVTEVGGVPAVVGPREAVLVPPEQPGALAAAVARVLEHPTEARARGEAAHQHLLENFSQTSWVEEHLGIYRSLAHPPTLGA